MNEYFVNEYFTCASRTGTNEWASETEVREAAKALGWPVTPEDDRHAGEPGYGWLVKLPKADERELLANGGLRRSALGVDFEISSEMPLDEILIRIRELPD